jgi:flagellar biosynthesis/type III secretory pathway chaperone
LSSAQTNKDYVLKEICAAVDKIHAISTNKVNSESLKHIYDQSSSLLAALDDLDVIFIIYFKISPLFLFFS